MKKSRLPRFACEPNIGRPLAVGVVNNIELSSMITGFEGIDMGGAP